jgi:UDP-N-acetylmuramyl pentapeptide synthase
MRNRIVSFGPHRIIEDAYNANPLSMRAALQTLKEFKSPRVAVLGDMLELGNLEEIAHQQLLQETEGVERVMLVGERLKLAAQTSSCTVEVFESHEAAAEALALFLRHEEAAGRATTVLLKGSRGARMERVLEVLRSAAVEEK